MSIIMFLLSSLIMSLLQGAAGTKVGQIFLNLESNIFETYSVGSV